MTRLTGALVGAALATVAAVAIHFPLAGIGVPLLALFLALTACVYLGALLAQPQTTGVALSEIAVGFAVFLCAIFGTLGSVLWLAAGYALHGLWDWAHDAGWVATQVSKWFPPACAVFDFLIAGFVFFFIV